MTAGGGGGSGANRTLSNLLAPTAINESLLPNNFNTLDLGSELLPWRIIHGREIEFIGDAAVPTNITDTQISKNASGNMAFNVESGGAGYQYYFNGQNKWGMTSSSLTGDNIILQNTLTLKDNAFVPNANGMFGRTGDDVFVFSGGSLRNLSNITGGANTKLSNLVWRYRINTDLIPEPGQDGVFDLGTPDLSWSQINADMLVLRHNDGIVSTFPSIGRSSNALRLNSPVNNATTIEVDGIPSISVGALTANLKDAYQLVFDDSFSTPARIEKFANGQFTLTSPNNFALESTSTIPATTFRGNNTSDGVLAHGLLFWGKDSNGSGKEYASIKARQVNSTAGSVDGSLEFSVQENNVFDTNYMILNGLSQQIEMFKPINMGGDKITNVSPGVNPNDVATVSQLGGGGGPAGEPYTTTVQTPSISSGSVDINMNFHTHTITVNQNITTINFTNIPAPGSSRQVRIRFDHDGVGGSFTIDFPAEVGGQSITLDPGRTAMYVLHTEDGGSSYEIQTLLGSTLSGGIQSLSELGIDVTKNWGGFGIENVSHVQGDENPAHLIVSSANGDTLYNHNGWSHNVPLNHTHKFYVEDDEELTISQTTLNVHSNSIINVNGILGNSQSIIFDPSGLIFSIPSFSAFDFKFPSLTAFTVASIGAGFDVPLSMNDHKISSIGIATITDLAQELTPSGGDFLLGVAGGFMKKFDVGDILGAGGGDSWSDPIDSNIVTDGTLRNLATSSNRMGNIFSNLLNTNNIIVNSTVSVLGDTSLGNSPTDDISFNGTIQSDINMASGTKMNFANGTGTASAGFSGTLPSSILGYIIAEVGGAEVRIPYYAV